MTAVQAAEHGVVPGFSDPDHCWVCGLPIRLWAGMGQLGWVHATKTQPEPTVEQLAVQALNEGRAVAWQRGYQAGLSDAVKTRSQPLTLNPYGTTNTPIDG